MFPPLFNNKIYFRIIADKTLNLLVIIFFYVISSLVFCLFQSLTWSSLSKPI